MRRFVHVSTADEWRTLIGEVVRFHAHIAWEDEPWDYAGELEAVDLQDTGDPRYPRLYVTGEWGSCVPDASTMVELMRPGAVESI